MAGRDFRNASVIYKPKGYTGIADIPGGWDNKEGQTIFYPDPNQGVRGNISCRIKDLRYNNKRAMETTKKEYTESDGQLLLELGFSSEAVVEALSEGLEIKVIGVKGSSYYLDINGNVYGYQPVDMDMDRFIRSFTGVLKYSAGKALAWLKRNSKLVQGAKNK